MRILPLLLLAACWGQSAYILEGTVVDKPSDTQVVVAHEEIKGFMPAMTMPFDVRDPAEIAAVEPGDRIYARLMVEEEGSYLAKVRVTGHGVPPPSGSIAPLTPGELLPSLVVPVGGEPWTIGAGQGRPTVVSFVYTRCPMPEFCPATIARMQGLQGALLAAAHPEQGPRILLITIDPAYDTREVLTAYATAAGADPRVWAFGRLESPELSELALRAGLIYGPDGDQIAHSLRMLVLDGEGRLVARYDDMAWDQAAVLAQL